MLYVHQEQFFFPTISIIELFPYLINDNLTIIFFAISYIYIHEYIAIMDNHSHLS